MRFKADRGTSLAPLSDVRRHLINRWVLTAVVCVAVAIFVRADVSQRPAPAPTSPSAAAAKVQAKENRDAPELAEFKKRVEEYATLRSRLEATLPKLPKEATPEQIDRNQRALATLIVSSRPKVKQGDVFTPAGQTYVRALLKRLFANIDRARLRATIQDENPGAVQLRVNGRYPDEVPLATMPPEVLEALPPLPEEIEYRFVGDSLILLDARAHLLVDLVHNALPK
jgi:hypothetical protein